MMNKEERIGVRARKRKSIKAVFFSLGPSSAATPAASRVENLDLFPTRALLETEGQDVVVADACVDEARVFVVEGLLAGGGGSCSCCCCCCCCCSGVVAASTSSSTTSELDETHLLWLPLHELLELELQVADALRGLDAKEVGRDAPLDADVDEFGRGERGLILRFRVFFRRRRRRRERWKEEKKK